MTRRELLARSTTPDGAPLTLTREGVEYVVRVRGETLMSSRQSGSEQAMAAHAFAAGLPEAGAQVLIGGLGMGFTLRAALDAVCPRTRVTVVELLADVVSWNRGVLAPFAGHPLDDPRVHVVVADLLDHLGTGALALDAILLDVDNGPEAFTVDANERLYQPDGLERLRDALREGGTMVLWSAFRSRAFEKRLRGAGFDARSVTVRARAGVGKGARHTLFVARRV